MANVNRPSGARPLRHLDGSAWNGALSPFLIPASDGTAVYVGDFVKNAGAAAAAGTKVNGMDCEGIPTAARISGGTTGQDIVGVVVGFMPDPNNLMNKHRAASTDRIALVVTDPTVIYEMQEDAVTTPLSAPDVGLNVAFSTTAGSATTGMSGIEIVSTSKATTATLPLKLLGLVKRVDNAFNTAGAGSDKARFEVMLNTGAFMPNTAGA